MALLTLVLFAANDARAQAPLRLQQLREGAELSDRVALLRDPGGELTLADVRARDAQFVANEGRALSFGFDDAALWLRFSARNDGERAASWVLEVTEPTLDHLDLYALHRDGRAVHRRSGDKLPFASRPVSHANFVFELENPAHDAATYYLRVQSGDVLRAPLRAWAPRAYTAQHDRGVLFHAWCLGALVLVALYHSGVFWLVRRAENAWYALVAVSLAAVLMSLDGHLGQLLLPHHPELANRGPPVSIAVAMLTVAFFTYEATVQLHTQPHLSRVLLRVALSTIPLVCFAVLAPAGIVLRVVSLILLVLTLTGPFVLVYVRRYHIPEMGLYSLGWYALIGSIPIAILRYGGVWPDGPISQWVLPAGFVAYGVLNSLALASLASRLRRELATMNEKLVSNVQELQQALIRAEEANASAQRATKAKDEFVATMSHELRTPLNMIINIPQGLIEEFAHVPSARCEQCGTTYLLDDADRIDTTTLCEDCGGRGTLVEGTMVKFRGDDARCLRFLQKIERSGQHLLQMVNGVLDYNKLESGRFQLELGPVEMEPLLREVNDQMIDLAHRKDIQLELISRGAAEPLNADALRLKQVLINLVANAIKFSETGTTVSVRWTSEVDGELIEVIDQGIGIAPADHERIFTGFEQVHKGDTRKYGGTGLGLSISRSLVRMHGGELSVRSTLGAGSTFLIRLPRMRSALSLPTETRSLPPPHRRVAS